MAIATKLTNLQQELLKVFSRDIPENELKGIKTMLIKYFADKATKAANKVWDECGYTNELMDEWVNDLNQ